MSTLWNKCVTTLEAEIPSQQFNTWIRPLQAIEGTTELKLLAPNKFVLDWVKENFINRIEETVAELVDGTPPRIVLAIGAKKVNHERPVTKKVAKKRPEVDKKSVSTHLSPAFLFDNFVEGKSNQLAKAASIQVAENVGHAYNPLFIYGGVGLGKTHLMQGIGNAILQKNPSAKVYYVPIETFMNEMIESIRTNKNEEFRKKYRPADVLIIDDIQFISTFKKTKEELFNTFNALYEANKQIVIASDRPPNETDNLPDRLRTRFQGGMVVDIQAPDLETRIAILQQEAKMKKVEIPPELLMFIAQNVENNVRELQGAMTKVITLSKINGDLPTVDDLAKMLQVDIDSKRKRVSTNDVIDAVSDRFDVNKKDIVGKRRTAYIATARQVVMYILREELELPLEKVAQSVNRKDHTTVLHACEKIERLIKEDTRMKGKIDDCMQVFAI